MGIRDWYRSWSGTGAKYTHFSITCPAIEVLFADIPVNEYYEYFGPDYKLDVKSSNTDDLNTPAYLDRVKRIVMENLRHVGGPPSAQMTGAYNFLAVLNTV